MNEEFKSICFICHANYCRSPVAEMLLKEKYKNSINVSSAGLRPMVTAGMDPRSLNFLKKNKIPCSVHNPKKIDVDLFKLSNIVFAMDTIVLMQLNRFYKKYRNKFRLVSFQHRNINIVDPYNLPRKKYENVMENIKFVIDNLSIEEIN